MKVVVAVVVYNRVENIKKWVHCWGRSERENCQLVIIHNHDSTESYEAVKRLTKSVDGIYIPRPNVGYDIGALQDVVMNRLEEFPDEYEFLLWCTDDTLPMTRGFVWEFVTRMEEGISLVCMEISKEVRAHIRTTGFMLRAEHVAQLKFPINPITNKQQCYDFEHRGGPVTLLEQVQQWGTPIQATDIESSPLWDTGHRSKAAIKRSKRREEEFTNMWKDPVQPPVVSKSMPLVTFICPAYNNYPQIISSLLNQSYKNWNLLLVHDGPDEFGFGKVVENYKDDPRIKYWATKERSGNWGHSLRQSLINHEAVGEFIVITNADNYHAPSYIEYMLRGFERGRTVATYCSHMVHNYKAWQVIPCRLERGYVDCAGVMVRTAAAREVGWRNLTDHSADWLFFRDLITAYGANRFIRVEGCLLIHN